MIKHFPSLRQKELQAQSGRRSSEIVQAGWLPQITINASGTWQTDITSLNLPPTVPIQINPLSRDQYRLSAEINQLLYDSGLNQAQQRIQEYSSTIKEQEAEIEKRKLMEQLYAAWYTALLMKEYSAAHRLIANDLQLKLDIANKADSLGIIPQKDIYILQAEILKIEQKIIESETALTNACQTISLLSGLDIQPTQELEIPIYSLPAQFETVHKPDMHIISLRKKIAAEQIDIVSARTMPRIWAFAQGGYGRPGLNMLSNEFTFYGITGARASWNLSSLFTSSKEKEIQQLATQVNSAVEMGLEKSLAIQYTGLQNEVNSINEQIRKDEQMLELRKKITLNSAAALEQGIITATDYTIDANAQLQAAQTLALHKVQSARLQGALFLLLFY